MVALSGSTSLQVIIITVKPVYMIIVFSDFLSPMTYLESYQSSFLLFEPF